MTNISKANPMLLQIGRTKCCHSKWSTIPACFGDPQMTICIKCCNETEVEWRPMYEQVSKGTYRLIKYKD